MVAAAVPERPPTKAMKRTKTTSRRKARPSVSLSRRDASEELRVSGPVGVRGASTGWEKFYAVVRRIPRGKVSTYGAIAMLAGKPHGARQVGYALAALRGSTTLSKVPWHRVLGSRSRKRAGISLLDAVGAAAQRDLLEREGIQFDDFGFISLAGFGWKAGK